MDRNDFTPGGGSTSGQSGGSQNPGGSSGYGNAGNTSGAQGYAAGTTANVGQGFGTEPGTENQQSQGFTDRARDIAGSAQDKLADVGSTVRDRAGNLKNSLADALDSGANKLRQRSSGSPGNLAGSTTTGSVALETDNRMAQVSSKVAGGMESTADWLRDADLANLRTGIERQVKDHPGRTLLIAAGLGYLIGKAFRNNK
ncbi:MAG TPA: hypothetical protein VNC18_17965 [Gemmatimonadaceae bacterium]|jgi:ElaB/YqjD/DUF883 family membrane-anchored ribosome-binding protein|nr:hypothetical protein [Gemmatimonadaceae bacterium]